MCIFNKLSPHVFSVPCLSMVLNNDLPTSSRVNYRHDRTGDEMATSTRHRRLNEFDMENETVTAYLERVELYFDANDVAEDKQVTQ